MYKNMIQIDVTDAEHLRLLKIILYQNNVKYKHFIISEK